MYTSTRRRSGLCLEIFRAGKCLSPSTATNSVSHPPPPALYSISVSLFGIYRFNTKEIIVQENKCCRHSLERLSSSLLFGMFWFESRLEHRLYWLRLFVVFFSPSRQTPIHYSLPSGISKLYNRPTDSINSFPSAWRNRPPINGH
jgi:hypothetical protein